MLRRGEALSEDSRSVCIASYSPREDNDCDQQEEEKEQMKRTKEGKEEEENDHEGLNTHPIFKNFSCSLLDEIVDSNEDIIFCSHCSSHFSSS